MFFTIVRDTIKVQTPEEVIQYMACSSYDLLVSFNSYTPTLITFSKPLQSWYQKYHYLIKAISTGDLVKSDRVPSRRPPWRPRCARSSWGSASSSSARTPHATRPATPLGTPAVVPRPKSQGLNTSHPQPPGRPRGPGRRPPSQALRSQS